jgi:hypothetical protein
MAAEFIKAVDNETLEYVEIARFQTRPGIGLSCGCSCPKCGKKVGARIFIDNPISSCFFHTSDENNVNCGGGASETQLHLLAKKLLEQERKIFLPDPDGQSSLVKFNYLNVSLEKKIGLLRPDLVLTSESGQMLFVEITVSHKTINDPLKMSRLAALGIPSVEISLDRTLLSRAVLKHTEALGPVLFNRLYHKAIIHDISRKLWLVKPDGNLELEQEVDQKVNLKGSDDFSLWILVAFAVILFLVFKSWFKRP